VGEESSTVTHREGIFYSLIQRLLTSVGGGFLDLEVSALGCPACSQGEALMMTVWVVEVTL